MYISLQSITADERSEGLVWASGEGCLEDVVFLLSTGVKVNGRGQVRVGMSLLDPWVFYFPCGLLVLRQ